MGDNRNAPPRATPPNADFLKNERRLFSSSAGILPGCGCSIVSESFNPNFFNNFCDGVMVVSIYETRLFNCGLRIADCPQDSASGLSTGPCGCPLKPGEGGL